MDIFQTRYYDLNRRLLTLIGQWPYQKQRDKLLRQIIVFFIIFSCSFHQAKTFILNNSFEFIIEGIPLIIVGLIVGIKYVDLCINTGKTKELFEYMRHDWAHLTAPEELIIIHKSAEEGRVYIMYCTVATYLCGIASLFPSLSPIILDFFVPLNESRPREHPFPIIIFDNREDLFYLILFQLYFAMAAGLAMLLASDTMYMAHLQHACGLFRIAGYQLEHALDEKSGWTYSLNTVYRERLKIIHGVEYHKKAIMFTARINSYYGRTHFISLLLGALAVIITLFCTVTCVGTWKKFFLYALTSWSQIIYLFVITYPGQKLLDDSAAIRQCISRWYTSGVNTQKIVLFIMQKCMIPSTVVIGKVFIASMESYSSIIQTTMSYFTTLSSLR